MNDTDTKANPMRTAILRQGLLNQNDLRVRYKSYYQQWQRLQKKLMGNGMDEYETYAHMPTYPSEFHELRCGAKTRAGTPCKMKCIYANSRCKLHGGLSTGPKSIEGKAKVAKNGLTVKEKKQTP